MEKHKKIFHGDKHLKCSLCFITFKNSEVLKLHVENIENHKPSIKCKHNNCKELFTRKNNMVKHFNRKHRKVKGQFVLVNDCKQFDQLYEERLNQVADLFVVCF